MRRRGFTAVELIAATALSALVLGALFTLWGAGARVNGAARASAMLSGALAIEQALWLDAEQFGLDRAQTSLVAPAKAGAAWTSDWVSFFVVRFDGDRTALEPVRWRLVKSADGRSRVERTQKTAAGQDVHVFPEPVESLGFEMHTSPGGGALLSVHLGGRDGDRTFEHALALRLNVPARLQDRAFDAVCTLVKAGELFGAP